MSIFHPYTYLRCDCCLVWFDVGSDTIPAARKKAAKIGWVRRRSANDIRKRLDLCPNCWNHTNIFLEHDYYD